MNNDEEHLSKTRETKNKSEGYSRKRFMRNMGGALVSGGLFSLLPFGNGRAEASAGGVAARPSEPKVDRVAADPTDIPDPIERTTPKTHDITLESKDVIAEIEPGVEFKYMTYGGQVPGPMIRVRQGDTVNLTFVNNQQNTLIHNVDFHAVYGTGGGSEATLCPPGQSRKLSFKLMYPGAFIYHCAVPQLDEHISSGMFGMIVVEPEGGLPDVDHEFYLGQHEVYSKKAAGEKGFHEFDTEAMKSEDPTYVLLNGEKKALTADRYGTMKVKRDETARIFMVTGGPNLTSSFHAIGNVWTKAWREGAIASEPEEYVQTCHVAPGSCGIFEMDFPVPEKSFLVDHSLTRYAHKGMLGVIEVEGEPRPDIFNPKS
ncbi:MAG: copper-containing nitrite reductase [Balneolaceae bacterium]|nr:copper-containing nitrite reductase [Balneolaceae bacterium]